jgi:co-chaperonin GroES (HSP10)
MSVHSESVQLNQAGTAFITVTRDQGTVTAISGSDVTLKEGTSSVTYKTVTETVASGATVTRNDETAALTDIKVGDTVSISQSSDGSQVRAYDPTYKPTAPTGGRGGFGGGHGGPPPAAAAG